MSAEIRLIGTGFDFTVPLGDGAATVADGGAIFEEVARPERRPLTDYTGDKLVRVEVPAFFDGHRDKRSVQGEVNRILDLADGRDGEAPPSFVAHGPIPYSGLRFVMEQPDWGEGHRRAGDGALIRQALTLKLTQFVDPAVVRLRRKKKGPRTVKAKKNDTLVKIAARELGDASKAKKIGKLNDIRDTRKKLNPGRVIKLPAA